MLRRRERLLRPPGGPEGLPMGGLATALETEKDDSDDGEVEPPMMYEICLQNETSQKGITVDSPRGGGWVNVMPVSASLVPTSGALNAASSVPSAIHDMETVPPLEIIPISSAQRSIVTSVLIAMPAPHANELPRNGNSGGTASGTAPRADQRVTDMLLGVHEVLGVHGVMPTR